MGGLETPVTLTIAGAGAGEGAGLIRFGAPKSCTATLQFSGIDADQDFWFRVIGTDGATASGCRTTTPSLK